MKISVIKLTYRLLQFILWAVAVESFSSHFVGVGRNPQQYAPFEREIFTVTHRRWTSIFSSRQQYDEMDDGYDDYPSAKFREPSEDEIRLRRMAKNSKPRKHNEDDDNDESVFYDEDRDRSTLRNGRLAKYDNSFDEDDDYDDFYDDEDDDFDEDDETTGGNFWSNPQAGAPQRRRQRQPRRYDDEEENFARRSSRPRSQGRRSSKRAPAPTAFGEPPKVFKDFYDQLFWYGFDIEESAEVGDNTVFGGTKGKFNGFNYLLPEQDEGESKRSRTARNSARRLPPSRNGSSGAIARNSSRSPRRNTQSDYYLNSSDEDEDDDYDYDDDDDFDRAENSRTKRRTLASSLDTPNVERSSSRNAVKDYNSYDDYEDDEDEDDDYMYSRRRSRPKPARYDEEDEYMDRRSGGRRRRRQQSRQGPEWTPLGMIESFLGIDREEMDYQAEVYNAKMGLGKRNGASRENEGRSRRSAPTRRRSARDDPGRPGYAYRYDAELDEESTPILDIELPDDEVSDSETSNSQGRQLSLEGGQTKPRKKERSWEERQIAMERVPPIEIKAWGPAGELPMSAREKAFLDAQEDIETARRKLNLMKKKEAEAKEEITILKVDADRQQIKLREYPRDRRSRRDIEELRQLELDIDDASRDLRQARNKVNRAVEKLEELEERHHAIMSCYNIDQASSLIGETLNSFSAPIQGSSATTSTLQAESSSTDTSDVVTSSAIDDSKSTDSED